MNDVDRERMTHPGAGEGNDGRRAYEEQLKDRDARFAAIFETVVDGIATIDERGIIESVNPALERMFGYTREELLGQNVSRLMPSPYREQHDGYLRRYLETGEARIIGIGREVSGQRKDGTVFPLELAVSEVKVTGRRVFTGVIRDISDRRRAEEQARFRLDELAHTARLLELGEMTSGIAHEVNQPLAAISSFAEACLRILRSASPDLETVSHALSQIAAQSQRAGDIIHRLRDLARRGESERENVSVDVMVAIVLQLLDHELRRAGVAPQLEFAEPMPEVRADRIQIEQVLFNLLRNALDAMRDRPAGERQLSIDVRAEGDERVRITVADTGHGLPEHAPAERVFDNFYTTKPDGMGIGLGISRTIVEAHGGKLWAENNASGGASFHFTLPLILDADG